MYQPTIQFGKSKFDSLGRSINASIIDDAYSPEHLLAMQQSRAQFVAQIRIVQSTAHHPSSDDIDPQTDSDNP